MGTSHTITTKITMNVWTCPVAGCGVLYGIADDYADELRSKGKGYYCPNGHYLSWAESAADKLKKQLSAAREDAAYWRDQQVRVQVKLQDQKNKTRAEKAAKTRVKNRVANGVCPCCKRSFQNVKRHMETQHPEFGAANKSEMEATS